MDSEYCLCLNLEVLQVMGYQACGPVVAVDDVNFPVCGGKIQCRCLCKSQEPGTVVAIGLKGGVSIYSLASGEIGMGKSHICYISNLLFKNVGLFIFSQHWYLV